MSSPVNIERDWVVPAALTLLHVIIATVAFHPSPYTGGDDANYISLAQSLIEGQGYRDIWDPASPPHTQYPPVFPVLIAAGLLAGLTPAVGLKVMMVVLSSAAVFASCLWLRKATTIGSAFCGGFFIAISPEIVRMGKEVLSDVPFWLFSTLALIAWHRAAEGVRKRTAAPQRLEVQWVVIATLLTLAANFTRSAGVPLLVAVVIWLGIRRDWRALMIVCGMSALPILAWWMRGSIYGSGGYLAPLMSVDPYNPSAGTLDFGDLIQRVRGNLARYTQRQLPRIIVGRPTVPSFFGLAVVAMITYGWARRLRQPAVAEVWLPLYLGLVVLWPLPWSAPRFLLPVVPLLALYAAETVHHVARRTSHPRVLAGILLGAGAALAQPTLAFEIKNGTVCSRRYAEGDKFPCVDPAFRNFFEVAEASRGRLPSSAVVLSRKPGIFFLHSGYQSRLYPLFAEPDSLFNLARRTGARYVLVDEVSNTSARYLQPIVVAYPDHFCTIPALSRGLTAMFRIESFEPLPPPASSTALFRHC